MLQAGLSHEITFSVTPELSAKAVGSGTLEVLATPIMIARMEQAACMSVTCRAELVAVDNRRLVFQVTARDAQGTVGEGVHERAIIQNERFLAKAQKKLTP